MKLFASKRNSTANSRPEETAASPTVAAQLDDKKKRLDSHRCMGWAALLLFSSVALASHLSATKRLHRDDSVTSAMGKDDWFILVVCMASMACSCFALLGYAVARACFAGSILEGILAVIAQIVWVCGMPVIMDPNRNIAVSKGMGAAGKINQGVVFVGADTTTATTTAALAHEFTFIRNANMYFFAWASTIAIVYICGRFARAVILERRRRDDTVTRMQRKNALGPKTNFWYLLALASLVVMVDSIEMFQSFSCPGNNPDLCLGTKYAVSLGTVGTFWSCGASVLATLGKLNPWLETLCALLAFGLYASGVALITFNDGPGTTLGNLYFATWMGASVTVVLLARSVQDLVLGIRNPPVQLPPDEKPVEFPDIEMGEAPKKKQDEGVEDEAKPPSWAKVEDVTELSKSSTKEEAKPEEEVEMEWNPTASSKSKEEEVAVEEEIVVEPEGKAESDVVEDNAAVMAEDKNKATATKEPPAVVETDAEAKATEKAIPKKPTAVKVGPQKKAAKQPQPKKTDTSGSKASPFIDDDIQPSEKAKKRAPISKVIPQKKIASAEAKASDDNEHNPFKDDDDVKPAETSAEPKKQSATVYTKASGAAANKSSVEATAGYENVPTTDDKPREETGPPQKPPNRRSSHESKIVAPKKRASSTTKPKPDPVDVEGQFDKKSDGPGHE